MNKFDPDEVFLNDFGERLKHGKNVFTVRQEVAKHCALTGLCVCSRDSDCGGDVLTKITCKEVSDFAGIKVCQPGRLEQMAEQYSKYLIEMLAITGENNDNKLLNYFKSYNIMENFSNSAD